MDIQSNPCVVPVYWLVEDRIPLMICDPKIFISKICYDHQPTITCQLYPLQTMYFDG